MGKGKEENKESNKGKGENKESHKAVVLKALIHCEGCSDKISSCLRGFDGVEQVEVDRENNKVVVKGKVTDPVKILERLQKKYSKNVELVDPKPKPDNKQRKEPEKKEQAQVKTVVLKTYIHCEGCANDIKRTIEKMQGVLSVEVDKVKSIVIVRGTVESAKIVEHVKKRLGKHADILKEEGNKKDQGKDKEKEKGNENIVMFSYPPQYSTQYLYPDQTFSDENVFACSIM